MTVPDKFARHERVIFPPELRAKYPLPEPYDWQDETETLLAAVMVSTGSSQGQFIGRFIVWPNQVVSCPRAAPSTTYKTLGVEDSMRLVQSLLLFGE